MASRPHQDVAKLIPADDHSPDPFTPHTFNVVIGYTRHPALTYQVPIVTSQPLSKAVR